MIQIGELNHLSRGSDVTVIGECENLRTYSWLMERHGEFVNKPRNIVQQKIEGFLKSVAVGYVFKNPVWIDRKRKSFFIDYYIPGYKVMIDIRPLMSSAYFDARVEKERRFLLKSLTGYIYLPVDFSDLKDDRYIRKIRRALLKSVKKNRGA